MTRNAQVALIIAEAQLTAARVAMGAAHIDFNAGRITNVQRGRLLAKQTRLETKVFELRHDVRAAA